MPTAPELHHIRIDDTGTAWIVGTTTKVIEVAIDKIAYGSSSEEIQFQYPHLSLAQVHAALAYYYDHQAELDHEIERRQAYAEKMREKNLSSPLQERLRKLARN